MGQLNVKKGRSAKQIRLFEKCFLNEVRASEQMIDNGMIESGGEQDWRRTRALHSGGV